MNIPSSNTGVRAASERLPVVTGQALARLDQELSQGQFPQDVFLQKDAEGAELALISQPRPGAVALDGKRSAVKNARTATFGRSLVGAPLFLAPGAMLGYVGMPGYPLVGAAVGAPSKVERHRPQLPESSTRIPQGPPRPNQECPTGPA